jgi:DNA-binding NarL/FixJ family response regulator
MDDRHLLDRAALDRLGDAIRAAQGPRDAIPRQEVLDVWAAAPDSTRLTIDYAASEALGMPILFVHLPVAPRSSPLLRLLSPRELEVASLVAAGWTNKEIGVRLRIRTSTVKEHVHRILAKTGLPSRAAVATAYAVGHGLGDGGPAGASILAPDGAG